MTLPVTVNELLTGNPNVGDNTILIAITRRDARYLPIILEHYINKGTAKKAKEISKEILGQIDGCLPRS